MGEFWKKLSVPSKFKANSTNTYKIKGKITVIWGITDLFLKFRCEKYKKKPPVYNWTCGINKMR